jgi:tetratricopeptide (TPR) repeat protein
MKALLRTFQHTAQLAGSQRRLLAPFLVCAFVQACLVGLVWLAPQQPFSAGLAPPVRYFYGDRVLHYPWHLWFLYFSMKHAHLLTSLVIGAYMSGIACAMVQGIHQQTSPTMQKALAAGKVRYGRTMLLWVITWGIAKGFMVAVERVVAVEQVAPMSAALLWGVIGALVALQALLAYAIPVSVFEDARWWKALWRSIREALRHPLSTLAVVFLPSVAVIGFGVIASPNRLAGWMSATTPEIAVAFVAIRLVVWTLADAFLTVGLAHLWWMHRLPAATTAVQRIGETIAHVASQPIGRRAGQVAAGLAVAALISGCSANYDAERLFWRAQQLNKALAKEGPPSPERLATVVDAFNKVIKKTPDTSWAAQAHLIIGSLYASQKRFTEAREVYQLLLQNYNQYKELSLSAKLAIAKTYEAEDNWSEAISYYRDISEFHPWSRMGLEAPLYIAAVHEQRRERDLAMKAYESAAKRYAKLIPDAPTSELGNQAKAFLALAYQRLGSWEQAITALEDLASNAPEASRPLILLTLASVYQARLGSAKKAGEIYAKLIQDYPDHPMGKLAKAQLAHLGLEQPLPLSADPVTEGSGLFAPAAVPTASSAPISTP